MDVEGKVGALEPYALGGYLRTRWSLAKGIFKLSELQVGDCYDARRRVVSRTVPFSRWIRPSERYVQV